MADYARLIDAETWEFIRRSEAAYPPDTADKPIARQRRIYDAMCVAFFQGVPEGVVRRDHDAGAVPVRHYRCTLKGGSAVVLYLHGGGFVVGGLESHDDICADICNGTGLDLVSVDYRLLPEHRFSDAFADCETALGWVRKRFGLPIVLVGDSAGGNLAAALAHSTRPDHDIAGQVLIYPGLGGDTGRGSYLTHADAPLLARDDVLFYASLAGMQASFAPLQGTDFAELPPTLAISAQCDPLADDARDYAAAINAAGGRAVWQLDHGLVHGHLRARHCAKRARASFARVLQAISLLGSGQVLTPLPHSSF